MSIPCHEGPPATAGHICSEPAVAGGGRYYCIPVEVVKHAKLIGVILSDDLTWNMHVDSIVKKAAKRVYMLYQLKRAGIRQTDLVNVYISVVRPVLEYACPVWHTNLPKHLSDNIEMILKKRIEIYIP